MEFAYAVSTAAARPAPTFPFIDEPSESTFVSSFAVRASSADALGRMLMRKGILSLCAGFRGLEGIFSTRKGSMSK